ncbi:hypothetical protein A6B35_03440 [Mesorhizobium amorphae CCNWGS0123]|nr:hypothetical protein A6B35_03440 [Mesorhizobium amorphae CCNWGS0123]
MDAVVHGGWRQRLQVADILPVHPQDQVETGKILRPDLARCLSGNVDTVAGGDRDRAWVGGRAHLPAAGRG